MKLETLDALERIVEIRLQPAPSGTMSRQQRLERWAAALECTPRRYLRSLRGTEHASRVRRAAMRQDDSPLTVAFEDPVLRREGLTSDTYGEAIGFFGLAGWELHHIACYCRHGERMSPKTAARRVRGAARSPLGPIVFRGTDPLRIRV